MAGRPVTDTDLPSNYLSSGRMDYDEWFAQDPSRVDQDRQVTKDEIKSQVFFDDMSQGMSQAGGAGFGLVGMVIGAIYGLVDGVGFDAAIDAAIDEARERRENINAEVERVMDFRADIENKLAQFTTPMEQALRERGRMHGLQARAQGLTGPQALAAQMIAEQQYRNTIGPQMTQVIGAASTEARADALARLGAIEAKYGIQLASERQDLMEAQAVAEIKSGGASSIAKGIGAIGSGFGDFFDQMIDQANQNKAPANAGPDGTVIPVGERRSVTDGRPEGISDAGWEAAKEGGVVV